MAQKGSYKDKIAKKGFLTIEAAQRAFQGAQNLSAEEIETLDAVVLEGIVDGEGRVLLERSALEKMFPQREARFTEKAVERHYSEVGFEAKIGEEGVILQGWNRPAEGSKPQIERTVDLMETID